MSENTVSVEHFQGGTSGLVWTGKLEIWKVSWTSWSWGASAEPQWGLTIVCQDQTTHINPNFDPTQSNICCRAWLSHTGNLVSSQTWHRMSAGPESFCFSAQCFSEMGSEPITHSLSVQPLTNTRHGTNLWHYVWHSVRHNQSNDKKKLCSLILAEMGDR